MSDQLNHNSDPETEWSNKKNLIIKQIEDKWKLEENEKVYIFDASGPVSDLPSHIKYIDYFQHFFEKYWSKKSSKHCRKKCSPEKVRNTFPWTRDT